MSKSLAIIGGLLVAGVIAAILFFSGGKDKTLEKETSGFVIDTVNAISREWNPRVFVKRADPGLIQAMASQPGQSVYVLFAIYRKLGGLKSSPTCHLKDSTQFDNTSDDYITATYICEAEYDNGPATLLITIRRGKEDSEWQVYYINVSSPYFSQINPSGVN